MHQITNYRITNKVIEYYKTKKLLFSIDDFFYILTNVRKELLSDVLEYEEYVSNIFILWFSNEKISNLTIDELLKLKTKNEINGINYLGFFGNSKDLKLKFIKSIEDNFFPIKNIKVTKQKKIIDIFENVSFGNKINIFESLTVPNFNKCFKDLINLNKIFKPINDRTFLISWFNFAREIRNYLAHKEISVDIKEAISDILTSQFGNFDKITNKNKIFTYNFFKDVKKLFSIYNVQIDSLHNNLSVSQRVSEKLKNNSKISIVYKELKENNRIKKIWNI